SGGHPILVVYNDTDTPFYKFGRYLGEILRAEGLNSYDMVTLGSVNAGQLTSHRVVILAESSLSGVQASLFTDYVNGGGYLIAIRPDSQIADLFGLTTYNSFQTNGYLKMPGSGPSQGLSTATLQIHEATDLYSTSGTVTIAEFYSDAT